MIIQVNLYDLLMVFVGIPVALCLLLGTILYIIHLVDEKKGN